MKALVRVDQVRAWRLSLPLVRPYHLSLGEITAFDTILVEMLAGGRGVGYGEATYVAGYTDERVESGWELAREFVRTVATTPPEEAASALSKRIDDAAFTVTAFATALDMLAGHATLAVDAPTRVPLLGLLNAGDEPELSSEIAALIERGFETLKVKGRFRG